MFLTQQSTSAFSVNAAGGGIVGTAVHTEHANKSVTG